MAGNVDSDSLYCLRRCAVATFTPTTVAPPPFHAFFLVGYEEETEKANFKTAKTKNLSRNYPRFIVTAPQKNQILKANVTAQILVSCCIGKNQNAMCEQKYYISSVRVFSQDMKLNVM